MKKILSVITSDVTAESYIGDQLQYFQERGGYECHLISSPGPYLEAYAKKQGIKYTEIQIDRQLRPRSIKTFWAIYKYMRKQKFDVVIAHSGPSACLISMTAAKLAGIPHRIELAHGALQEGLKGILRRFVIMSESFNSHNAEKVVIVSPSVAKIRQNDGIDKPEKQVLLSKGTCNGVDTIERFNPDKVSDEVVAGLKQQYGIEEGDFVVGYIGRLVRDKGIVELVEGFKRLRELHPEKVVKLLIVGSPEKRDALPQETLDFLSSDKSIIYTGFVPYNEIARYYSLMDTFILPSYREGFPTVVLEASSMGLPVVTTRKTGCIDSIVENETGLFADLNGESIAKALEAMMDKDFARRLGKNGRKWVTENYEHSIVREAMLQLIDSLTR
ncbi:glycosyltransferase family 4 protein [Prevotella sp. E13-27]|uniref:glycosyltransferase family 4 protein n=1 Tax=Prevotella sp. E13-27 TaxID=2938122 RepID=UPI00200AC7F4|nr:glycosyltransferase family 4 protein [Prevotella sp. E13-27]MCK8622348.1 glycosyltransferase family 4 protein [Prevotella sp. E13-27]